MKNVLFMTGSHPRHMHIAKLLMQNKLLKGVVFEEREEFVPNPPDNLAEIDLKNFNRHFADRSQAEERWFGSGTTSDFPPEMVLKVTKDELNTPKVINWMKQLAPDTLISYGVHLLKEDFLKAAPKRAWNIHGGLSPWFRGTITLFWPFYFLRPNWAGMTIHELSSHIDGGAIIHHSLPELKLGDGIHDVACKAVIQVGEDIVKILQKISKGDEIQPQVQKSAGKLFLTSDWQPQHLRLIYNTFNNDIVDQFLTGKIPSPSPTIVSALKKDFH